MVALDGDNADLRNNLGIVLVKLGDIAGASPQPGAGSEQAASLARVAMLYQRCHAPRVKTDMLSRAFVMAWATPTS